MALIGQDGWDWMSEPLWFRRKGTALRRSRRGGGGGVLSFSEGALVLVRIGEWAESNQVFLQAGPSVLLEQDRGQGGGVATEKVFSYRKQGPVRQREAPAEATGKGALCRSSQPPLGLALPF